MKWEMMLNKEKTVCMTVAHKFNPFLFDYTLSGSVIQHVDSYKYLGVTITNIFRWDAHITKIARMANTKILFLRRYLKQASK